MMASTRMDIFGNNVDMRWVVVGASLVDERLARVKELPTETLVSKFEGNGRRKLSMKRMSVTVNRMAHMLMKQEVVGKEFLQIEQVAQ